MTVLNPFYYMNEPLNWAAMGELVDIASNSNNAAIFGTSHLPLLVIGQSTHLRHKTRACHASFMKKQVQCESKTLQ